MNLVVAAPPTVTSDLTLDGAELVTWDGSRHIVRLYGDPDWPDRIVVQGA